MILATYLLVFESISEVFSPSKGTLVEILKGGMTAGAHKPELTLVEKIAHAAVAIVGGASGAGSDTTSTMMQQFWDSTLIFSGGFNCSTTFARDLWDLNPTKSQFVYPFRFMGCVLHLGAVAFEVT